MKIDIWSDFACPYCYGGMKKFEQALSEFNYTGEIEINYRSLQLNPNIKKGSNLDAVQLLADSYMTSKEETIKMIEKSVAFVEAEGLIYDYKNMIPANTLDAHRLIYYAKEYNKDKDMADRIFKAHFADGLDIGDDITLSNLAKEVGLDKENVLDMLSSEAYLTQINNDEQEGIKLNIDLVPTFIFNDKVRISGILSLESFTKALNS